LTESSAILKYLGDKYETPSYPREPRLRAQINERMDWLNTGLYRDLGYNFIYPQVFPHHRRPDDAGQAATLAFGRSMSKRWLGILDHDLIGPKRSHLCGDQITIADYFGAGLLTVGEVIRLDYSGYPNITRWLAQVKSRPSWDQTNAAFYTHFVAPFKDKPFEGL
jgi:glutathione S-transferase